MAARRCSTCAISYPASIHSCEVCDENTDYISNEDPHGDWQERVSAARDKSIAGVYRTTDDQVTRWRREQFERLGLDRARATRVSRMRDTSTQGWRVDLDTFRQLVAKGCTPDVAVDILV